MKTVAYLRVSRGSQDVAIQKLAVLDYARQKHFAVDRFVEVQVSARKSPARRRAEELLGTPQEGDRLVVSELSRLGRSLSQVIHLVEELVRRQTPTTIGPWRVTSAVKASSSRWRTKRFSRSASVAGLASGPDASCRM